MTTCVRIALLALAALAAVAPVRAEDEAAPTKDEQAVAAAEHAAKPAESKPEEAKAEEAKPHENAGNASPEDIALAALKKEYIEEESPVKQVELARRLLDALDRTGRGRGRDAAVLVDRLLHDRPDDPVLLWRRAVARRRTNDPEGAVADLERLARDFAGQPLGVRARRALPQAYLSAGRREQSAQADEDLIHDRLADPAAVLSRLTRTYALLGDAERTKSALDRLRTEAPEKVKTDADLVFLEADVADRLGSREEASTALMKFANTFPRDPRRGDALRRAAHAFEGQGQHELALRVMAESASEAGSQRVAVAARLDRGRMLEGVGRGADARDEYERVLHDAGDRAVAETALSRMIDMTVELNGRDAALALLAARLAQGERLAREAAQDQFVLLVTGMADELAANPPKAAYVVTLAERAQVTAKLPPAVRFAAAGLRETLGENARAAAMYKDLAAGDGPLAEKARAGLLRCNPRETVPAGGATDPDRLAALERDEAWPVILESLRAEPNVPVKHDVPVRSSGARAAFATGDAAWAAEVLDPLKDRATGSAALLRGDARALAHDWVGACRDYRAAAGPELADAEREWLEVRLASCEIRENRKDDAKRRLAAVVAKKPGEPAALAAERLLGELPDESKRVRGRRAS